MLRRTAQLGLALEAAHAYLILDTEDLQQRAFSRPDEQVLQAERSAELKGMKKNLTDVPDTVVNHNKGLCDPDSSSYSGYIKFDSNGILPSEKSYFFWLFESRSKPAEDPLVIWLTGGPGCSSQLALLIENGPCSVEDDGKTTKSNPHSWTNKANVMWVDQPASTGFSKGAWDDHDEDGVAADFYSFLQGFFAQFPQYVGRPFFITGESYAGHYVPAISHRVWAENQKIKQNNLLGQVKINLKGIAIGNGLTNPEVQYNYYPQMAYDGGKSEGGSLEEGVITNPAAQAFMKTGALACQAATHQCNQGKDLQSCALAFIGCNYAENVPYSLTGYNPYDMRIKCEHPPLCYDMSAATTYLNSGEVKQKTGAQGEWESCNMAVNKMFMADFMRNYHELIPDMLHDGIDVTVYAGDVDYICNWLGNKAWTKALDWKHKEEFNAAEDKDYVMPTTEEGAGKKIGRVRSFKNFHFVQIYEAGHMVPMDQPEAASQLINDVISGAFSKSEEEEVAVAVVVEGADEVSMEKAEEIFQ